MEQQKLMYEELTYIGKDFVKKFDNDDGTQTSSYKYKFKKSMDQQFSMNFWGYSNTKGADQLIDGEVFTIGFINKPNPKGDSPLKIARFFGKPDPNRPHVAQPQEVRHAAPVMSQGLPPMGQPAFQPLGEQVTVLNALKGDATYNAYARQSLANFVEAFEKAADHLRMQRIVIDAHKQKLFDYFMQG